MKVSPNIPRDPDTQNRASECSSHFTDTETEPREEEGVSLRSWRDLQAGSLDSNTGSLFLAKCGLFQRSPTFLAPGTSFVEDNFSMDGGWGQAGVWFRW